MLAKSRNDPHYFNSVILGRSPYWSGAARGYAGQREWCQDLVNHRVLALEQGNMTGKDFFVGGIIPWWLYTRRNSLVIVTGPGQSIIGSVTWKEVRLAMEGARFDMGAKISTGIKTSPHTVTLGTGWQALGFSTTSVERGSGQHNKNLLCIVEEASGVEQEAWDAIASLGFIKLLIIGNPLRPDGGFVDYCERAMKDMVAGIPKHLSVCHRNVPSTAGPHAHLESSPWGMASKTWIEEQGRKFGVESLWYRSHVLAIRPTVNSETLIPTEHIDACTSETAKAAAIAQRGKFRGGDKVIACDVGEGVGNAQTVIIVRDDMGILEIHASAFTDAEGAAEQMVRLKDKWGVIERDMSFDAAGSTGKKMKNHLKKLGCGRAHAYFGSDPGGRWTVNQRTASALALARRLNPKHFPGPGKVQPPFYVPPFPQWETMREELESLRSQLKKDKVALETKEEMRDALGRSPDYADCLTQTFWRAAKDGS